MDTSAVVRYFDAVKVQHATGQATEHSYRGALAQLMQAIDPKLTVINEARRIECGSPDLTIMRGDVPVGYVEAKDVGLDIRKMKGPNAEQQTRYRDALPNLIYTNGLDFDFYRHTPDGTSERIADVSIADYLIGLQPKPQRFDALADQLSSFASGDYQGQTITSSARLAKIMADKAKLIRNAFGLALVADAENDTDLAAQYLGFKETLIHDITKAQFADIYAETIVYGMFAARYHDKTLQNFSREEAMELLPASNPFLKKLFRFVAMRGLDVGVKWAIDELVQVFRATDVKAIMDRWSDAKDKRDPFLHFYENFLAEYNPKKRKARGVWYTPEPVVNFLVRAVDDVLRDEFGIADGLASTEMVETEVRTGQTHTVKRKSQKTGRMVDVAVPTVEKRSVHRVQILDPATGTGTFLAEVIRQIEPRVKAAGSGVWSNYVEEHLIPRLHGFELLMASYAMCHMKLDMMLSDSGYKPSGKPPRLSVYLTNTLEEPEEEVRDLLMAKWLSDEARGASEVKRDKPVMCIIGNPPYSGESANKGKWIMDLLKPYKMEPGGKKKLKERNSKWINDDYVKFIRFAEHMIEKNRKGILAFITNHGYLDSPTFRGMRWQLVNSFDEIYIYDLHGNAKKKEVSPDGSIDENVFDIQQGVALVIAIKNKETSPAIVYHKDVYGRRSVKYDYLNRASIADFDFSRLHIRDPHYDFVHRNYDNLDVYEEGFSLAELMPLNSMGVMTKRDKIAIEMDESSVAQKVADFSTLSREDLEGKYKGIHDARDWHLEGIRKNFQQCGLENITPILYRPFDKRFTYYTDFSRGFLAYPVYNVGRHLLQKNIGITTIRKADVIQDWTHALCIDGVMVHHALSMKEGNYMFPLYVYPEPDALDQARIINMDQLIRIAIEDAAAHPSRGRPDEVAIFDYIYGVLHCPAYRETYAEFLKIDFPRVPYPPSPDVFWDVADKGGALRLLHLMEPDAVGETPYPFEGQGDNTVEITGKKSWEPSGEGEGSVFINPHQRFEGVPQVAWAFWIGGYQPAQKWLKDRKGRTLSFEDVRHYQKIIKVLVETDRIMKTIEMPLA